jgi:tRNA threonylcarbamoyladenosine biosynthesis protein TsaB
MPSLRQILANHAPLLLIDAASQNVQVGWAEASGEIRWETSLQEAGIAIFRGLEGLGIDVNQAKAFAYCEGPGSVLGIRTAAMALRTWTMLEARPVFSYYSLAVVAEALGPEDPTVIADARRESWHQFKRGDALRRVPAAELKGKLVMPDGFRHWSVLPLGMTLTPYGLQALFPRVADADLFRLTKEPDAFLHTEPSYLTWMPHIHRAPPSS